MFKLNRYRLFVLILGLAAVACLIPSEALASSLSNYPVNSEPNVLEDFNKPYDRLGLGWQIGEGGDFRIVNNELRPTVGLEGIAVKDSGLVDGEFDLSMRAQFSIKAMEQVFRYIDNLNYLYVRLYMNQVKLIKMDNGVAISLASTDYPLIDGETYQSRVLAKGAEINIFINQEVKISYTLTGNDAIKYVSPPGTPQATWIGVRYEVGNVDMWFDNLSAYAFAPIENCVLNCVYAANEGDNLEFPPALSTVYVNENDCEIAKNICSKTGFYGLQYVNWTERPDGIGRSGKLELFTSDVPGRPKISIAKSSNKLDESELPYMDAYSFRRYILSVYGFTPSAQSFIRGNSAIVINNITDSCGGGLWGDWDRTVRLWCAQHEAAIHELSHAWWHTYRIQNPNMVKGLARDVVLLADSNDSSEAVNFAKGYVYGVGDWKGMYCAYAGCADPHNIQDSDLSLINDQEIYGGFSSWTMGKFKDGPRALPNYMWKYFEPEFTGNVTETPYYMGGHP